MDDGKSWLMFAILSAFLNGALRRCCAIVCEADWRAFGSRPALRSNFEGESEAFQSSYDDLSRSALRLCVARR